MLISYYVKAFLIQIMIFYRFKVWRSNCKEKIVMWSTKQPAYRSNLGTTILWVWTLLAYDYFSPTLWLIPLHITKEN